MRRELGGHSGVGRVPLPNCLRFLQEGLDPEDSASLMQSGRAARYLLGTNPPVPESPSRRGRVLVVEGRLEPVVGDRQREREVVAHKIEHLAVIIDLRSSH